MKKFVKIILYPTKFFTKSYTPKSVAKTVYLNEFLGALIISQGFYSKTAIQHLSEN